MSASADEERDIIVRALQELPATCRQAFLLRRIEGMRDAEIACVLEIPESRVHRYVVEAIEHCGRRLEEAGALESEP